MSRQSDRDAFIATMTREGLDLATIRALLRAETTLHRLAEAQCNGDWPADNGERKTQECGRCEGLWAPSVMRWAHDAPARLKRGTMSIAEAVGTGLMDYVDGGKVPGYVTGRLKHKLRLCPDCMTEDRVKRALAAFPGFGVIFNGDPRGHAVYVTVPSGATSDWGQRGIGVP